MLLAKEVHKAHVLSLVARSGALYYLSNEFSFRVLGMLDPVSQAVASQAVAGQ